MVLFILSFLTSCDGESEIIMVAASLEKIISEKHSNFENNDKFHLNYGGSLSHARRIINNQNKIGAVIFSSSESFEVLNESGIINKSSIKTFASNSLVIVSSSNEINNLDEFKTANKKLLIADPKIAPAGIYSNQAINMIFDENFIKNKLLISGDVSYVSNMIRSNKDFFGIVYKTEALKNNLHIVYNIPTNFHDKIEYKMGILSSNENIHINKFINDLDSKKNKNELEKLGFIID